jgi:hypothetical protein
MRGPQPTYPSFGLIMTTTTTMTTTTAMTHLHEDSLRLPSYHSQPPRFHPYVRPTPPYANDSDSEDEVADVRMVNMLDTWTLVVSHVRLAVERGLPEC